MTPLLPYAMAGVFFGWLLFLNLDAAVWVARLAPGAM